MNQHKVKKKILFITFGRATVPSVHFRLMIHREILQSNFMISFSEGFSSLWKNLLNQPDLLFIQKKQLPFFYYLLIAILFKSKVIYDFDDAIYLPPKKDWSFITRLKIEFRFILMCKLADLVMCPNSYLANEALKHNRNVRILPMCVPSVLDHGVAKESICLGWAGHPQSLHLLRTIEADIKKFQELTNHKNFILLCGEDPRMSFAYEWLPYSIDNQRLFFSKVNVGLAPSRNTPFDQGKSPIKIIQHFSHAQTVISNMKGGAEDIINDQNAFIVDDAVSDAWIEQMMTLIKNPLLVKEKSEQALKDFHQNFDSQMVGDRFVALINSVLR